jgi:tRNA(fMet)-specific endonuclease VapC
VKRLLDTNVCIDVLRGNAHVITRLRERRPEEYAVSAITEFELIQGAHRAPEARRDEESLKVRTFLAAFKVVPFDSASAALAGELNAGLLNRGRPVGIADVLIAATALSRGYRWVTNNLKDFEAIEELDFEDWR